MTLGAWESIFPGCRVERCGGSLFEQEDYCLKKRQWTEVGECPKRGRNRNQLKLEEGQSGLRQSLVRDPDAIQDPSPRAAQLSINADQAMLRGNALLESSGVGNPQGFAGMADHFAFECVPHAQSLLFPLASLMRLPASSSIPLAAHLAVENSLKASESGQQLLMTKKL
jgi:hypothetical protein